MKGIIVVDKIPENCRNIRGEEEIGCPFGGMVCQITQKDVMNHVTKGTKPENCPIKPLPEKMNVLKITKGIAEIQEKSFALGWNNCIDTILKGESD